MLHKNKVLEYGIFDTVRLHKESGEKIWIFVQCDENRPLWSWAAGRVSIGIIAKVARWKLYNVTKKSFVHNDEKKEGLSALRPCENFHNFVGAESPSTIFFPFNHIIFFIIKENRVFEVGNRAFRRSIGNNVDFIKFYTC